MTLEKWREFLSAHASAPSTPMLAGGKTPETHSIWQDPLFTNPSEKDFGLREQSPVAAWNLPVDEGAGSP